MIHYFHLSYFGPSEEGDILCDVETGRVYRVVARFEKCNQLKPAADAAICDGCGEVVMGFGLDPLPLRHHDCRFNGHLRRPSAEDEIRPLPRMESWT